MPDHSRVRALLPQRHPMLLVDRVLALTSTSIRTEKAVTATEPCYAHVPDGAPEGHYAYPESLLLESLGQSAALLWLAGAGAVDDDHVLMFVGARRYRVLGAAHPGDVLRHEVELDQVKADTVFATGRTRVGRRTVAVAGSLVAVRRPRSVLASGPPDPSHPDAPARTTASRR